MADGTEVYPKLEPVRDKVYRIAEAVSSLVPAGQAVLHSLITPPIQRRTEQWIQETEERLSALEESGEVDITSLAQSEVFSAIVLKSIQAVATTSQDDKLQHLKSFVTSIAKQPEIEEDEIHILFGILNDFTPSHVLALRFYSEPEHYANEISRLSSAAPKASQAQGGELAQVFGGDPEYWQSIFSTASGKFVVNAHKTSVKCNATTERTISGRGTQLGIKLLNLISG
jgi:hypothetical protein